MAQKTTKIPRLPLTDDYIFKRVFAFEGNESVLKDLLEAILRKNIKNVTIKNPWYNIITQCYTMDYFFIKTSGCASILDSRQLVWNSTNHHIFPDNVQII